VDGPIVSLRFNGFKGMSTLSDRSVGFDAGQLLGALQGPIDPSKGVDMSLHPTLFLHHEDTFAGS